MSAPEEKRSYSCSTQKKVKAELLPPKHTEDGERPPVGSGDDSIVVGIGKQVPRWDVVKQKPRQLKYFVQASKFLTAKQARDAAAAFQKAADLWNAMDFGVSILAAPDASSANFDLTYWDPEDPQDTTLAMAFFPNEKNQTVWVYASALEPKNLEDLPSIFCHEIGHIMGLRHEFAITGDAAKNLRAEGEGATQFMESNYYSVMSYNFPPTIQDTDKKGIKAFYKLNNGARVGGLPITDYTPTVKKR